MTCILPDASQNQGASPPPPIFGPDRGAVWQESYRLNAGRLMSKEFVERRDGSFYLIGSRVPLAHIVREFQRGESPEALRSHYPALSLEQVYGAITFYLGSQEDVEGLVVVND